MDYLIASLGGLVGKTNPFNVALGSAPTTGAARPAVEFGSVQRSGVAEVANDRQATGRADWNATQSDTFSFRYIRDDSVLTPDFFNNAGALPPFDTQQGGTSYTIGATWVHTFAARAVNEFRFSYTSINFIFGPTPATSASPLSSHFGVSFGAGISNLVPTLGLNGAIPQGRAHNNWQYQDALSYTFGRHTLKGGADVAHLGVIDTVPFNARGSITFNRGGAIAGGGGAVYSPLANYVDNFTGQAGQAAIVFGNPVIRPFVTMYAPYVEDTWRLKSNFTATFGLRYEYWGTAENALQFPAVNTALGIGLLGVPFPQTYAFKQEPDKNNFAPRIGFSYTPRFWSRIFGQDKTVIRAGYGIFYDGFFTNILDNTAASVPNANGGTITGGSGRGCPGSGSSCPAGVGAFQLIPSIVPRLNPLAGTSTIASNLVNPLTHQWNFDIQRELPGGFLVTAAYVGTRGQRLFANQEFNPNTGFDANGNYLPHVNPALGFITNRTNAADSIYHAAQLNVEHRMGHGIFLRAAYTFSKLIDDASEVFTTATIPTSFAQNPFCQSCDRGPSYFDHRHRLALAYIWDLPYVHGKDNAGLAILKAITEGWQTSATMSWQSGNPITVTDGFDVLGDGRSTNDRPNLGSAAAPFTSIGIDGAQLGPPFTPGAFYGPIQDCLVGKSTCVSGPASSFHFLIPALGVGNVGRNTVEAPGAQFYNMTIQRTFKVAMKHLEGQALMFRAEFLGAFNHPNLGFNRVGSSPTYVLTNKAFGDVSQSRYGDREIRFWLRYSF